MTIIEKIERFIRESLRHRYDHRAPLRTFLEAHEQTVRHVVNRSREVELLFSSSEPFTKFVYRFPQTRLYYSLYQNSAMQIKIVDFAHRTVVLIRNQNPAADFRFKLTHCRAYSVKTVSDTSDETASVALFWILPEDEPLPKGPEAALLSALQKERSREYERHLLAAITSNNHNALTEIDRWFAALHHIDDRGRLLLSAVQAPEFIWLHELYLQAGRWSELVAFYRSLQAEHFKRNPLLFVLAQRVQSFLQNTAEKTFEVPPFKETVELPPFLQQYLNESDDRQRDVALQNFWEYVQIPALQFRWEKEIRQNPDEFMAFAFLAVRRKFWWAQSALDFLFDKLPETHHAVFALLRIMLSQVCLRAARRLHVLTFQDGRSDYQITAGPISARFYSFGKQNFSCLRLANLSETILTVNKRVDFEIDFAEKALFVKPLVYRPPLTDITWQNVRIDYAGKTLWFPLVWEQATLKIDRCRLKFLRKKDRFQITIKNPDIEKTLTINGQAVVMRADRYAKHYLPIKKQSGRLIMEIFSAKGERLNALTPGPNAITLRGIAQDVFGIVKDEVRVRIDDYRRTHGMRTNGLQLDLLHVNDTASRLTVTCRKCPPLSLSLQTAEDFLQAFKNTQAAQLVNMLKIWVSVPAQGAVPIEELKRLLLARLNWLPEIESIPLTKFEAWNDVFNILIAGEVKRGDEEIVRNGFIRVFRSKKSPKTKYFLVEPKYWQNIFDFNFFNRDFTKN